MPGVGVRVSRFLRACRKLGPLARANGEWHGCQRVAADRVERYQERQMEGRGSRPGTIIARDLEQPHFCDDHRSRRGRIGERTADA